MAGKPVEVEIEAMLKKEVRLVQKKLKILKQLETEATESSGTDLDAYVRERELATYVNQYRFVLEELKRYGKASGSAVSVDKALFKAWEQKRTLL